MKDLIKHLVSLQDADSRILEKRLFIARVPLRLGDAGEPLKQAQAELEKVRQKSEALTRKKREKEKALEEINEKINKMKSRISDIKTNKEYQAHLKEIESAQGEISSIEEEILVAMEELDDSLRLQKAGEARVKAENEKVEALKRELDREVEGHEKELSRLLEERSELTRSIEPDVLELYMSLLNAGEGMAVTRAKNDVCLGCNMNIPPQLFVEIKKNEEIIRCPQCRRILYYEEETQE